jgi:AraC-like DNA-binding protein
VVTSTGEAWEIAAPRVPLPGVVRTTGYRSAGVPPGIHRGLPSPYLTFVISLDGPVTADFDRDRVASGRAPGLPSVVGGLHTRPAFIERPVSESGIELAVHPLAARVLFGMPARELAGGTVGGDDLWGRDTDLLHQRLRECASWDERFDLLRAVLQQRVEVAARRPGRRVRADVAEAWRWLATRKGNGTIGQLAEHVQLGGHQLTAVFRREVGLSPKRSARLMRYHAVVRRLSGPAQPGGLASCAAELGYADQAHLTREFVEFTGIPPRTWLAEELRFVQDGQEGTEAPWTP